MTFNTKNIKKIDIDGFSFKPCYKWMTFNTGCYRRSWKYYDAVLNLVING